MTGRDPAREVERFLEEHGNRSLLRFSTIGSVDDGKSTLIGRLLHDTKNLFTDHVEALARESTMDVGDAPIDFALVTDGLRAEREQGITIDVAYRYFSTARRNFIIADTPGHEQYTRNMATGASTANLAIILIDARAGVITQTRRHAFIASLLGIPRLLIAVNKMDLVDYAEDVFTRVRRDFIEFAARLTVPDLKFIPISALAGDNVVEPSRRMPWYHGETVLEHLETVYVESDRNLVDFRFPVQCVLRPDASFRGFAGQVASGRIRAGEEVLLLPSMRRTRVRKVHAFAGELPEAFAPQSVVIQLADEVDVSRGDMLVRPGNLPHVENRFEAMLVWMDEDPMDPERPYGLKHLTRETRATIQRVRYRVDVNTLSREKADRLALNEIGRVAFRTHQPLFFDPYERNRATGAFILIDPANRRTVAAGMMIDRIPASRLRDEDPAVERPSLPAREGAVTREEREARLGQRGITLWFTGPPGGGKTAIAAAVERALFDAGRHAYRLEGETLREALSSDLGSSRYDRREQSRRVAEVARLLNDAGMMALVSLVSPDRVEREAARASVGRRRFLEIHVTAPADVRAARRPAGTEAEIAYEPPEAPDLLLDTSALTLAECVRLVLELLGRRL